MCTLIKNTCNRIALPSCPLILKFFYKIICGNNESRISIVRTMAYGTSSGAGRFGSFASSYIVWLVSGNTTF